MRLSFSAAAVIGLVVYSAMPAEKAHAAYVATYFAGESLGTIALTEPGTPFTADFTEFLGTQPFEPAVLLLSLQSATDFTTLKIELDSGGLLELPSFLNSPRVAPIYMWNDSVYTSPPSSQVPLMIMPELWKQELADGVLSGRLWVEGTVYQPTWGVLQAQGGFLIPEPTTASLLGLGCLGLMRRKR